MLIFLLLFAPIFAATQAVQLNAALLENGENLQNFKTQFSQKLSQEKFVKLLDEDLTRAAVNGANTKTLFNLSLEEAKNLGAAIDCDFFVVTKSATLRRSSFQKDVYFESFAVIFLVSARSGRLIHWEHARFDADAPATAEKLLVTDAPKIAGRFAAKILEAHERERTERANSFSDAVLIEDLPDEAAVEEQKFRVPLPYRRLKPEYTEAARRLDIEATVDVAVELNERGEVLKTEIVRWAGFDLDEAAANTVKKMIFRPALRDGKAIPIRVILRYNFRDLQRGNEK